MRLDGVHNRAEVNGLLSSGAQIGEYAMSSGAPGYDVYVNQYTTTPDNYIDEVLSTRKDIDGAGMTHDVVDYYFHADDLFNVVLVTDESGDAVERYGYGDYGAPFYYDGSGDWIPHSVLNNTRLFNGREWDQETRFYYYRTRYLEPTMGRFTTHDSIGRWTDALNLGSGLGYAASNPQGFLDPTGMSCWTRCMQDALSKG